MQGPTDAVPIIVAIVLILTLSIIFIIIVGGLTRPIRLKRFWPVLNDGLEFVILAGMVTLIFGVYGIISGDPPNINLVRMFAAGFFLALSLPLLFIRQSQGKDALPSPKTSQLLDRSINDVFVIGISLQFMLLVLFVGEAITIDYAIPLFSSVWAFQIFLYMIISIYRFKSMNKPDAPDEN